MIKSGTGPVRPDHQDYDFHKTAGTVGVPEMPEQVDNDAGLWVPDQNAPNKEFNLPAMPYGCTDYAQNDVAIDYAKKLFNPGYTESKTGANAKMGLDMRVSFASIINDGVQDQQGNITKPFKQYFNVRSQATLDWFDAFSVCIYLGQADRRTISITLPWYGEFVHPVMGSGDGIPHVGSDGILPIPKDFSSSHSWHDAKIAGYVTRNTKGELIRNGEKFLKIKSWQGPQFADNGWCYMDRELTNKIFSIWGTIALVGSTVEVPNVQTIDLSWVQYVISFLRMIANNYIMAPQKKTQPALTVSPSTTPMTTTSSYLWDNPANARHSVRVICDEEGLPLTRTYLVNGKYYMLKDILCACVEQESQFYNILPDGTPTRHLNYVIVNGIRKLSSTDWGICQINDYWHIGPGKDFDSVDTVVHNPDKAVRFMARMFKSGHANLWSSFVSGAYKQWLS